ncbi:unnamed protein product, partial [Adineta ricciae]
AFSSGSSFSSADIDKYTKGITHKIIHKKGGSVFVLGQDIQSWQASVRTNPVVVRRTIENITSFIQTDKISELSEIELTRVRQEINKAVSVYVERNVIYGCMSPASESFNWVANVDDGACKNPNTTAKFGGFYRTCDEKPGLIRKCGSYQLNNFHTGGLSCPSGFRASVLHNLTHSCCKDIPGKIDRRNTVLYTCSIFSKFKSSSDVLRDDSPYVYGGSFTSRSVNPITNSATCPQRFAVAKIANDINVCFTRQTITATGFPFFGGFYSCNQGNTLLEPPEQKCPEGYSIYIMGAIDTECLLYVCLKFRNFNDLTQYPSVVLPPFFEIDIRNQTVETASETSLNSKDTTPSKSTNRNTEKATLGISITALAVTLVAIIVVIIIRMKKNRQRQAANNYHVDETL